VIGYQKMIESLDRGDSMMQSTSHFAPKPIRDIFRTYEMAFVGEPVRGAQRRALMQVSELSVGQLALMGLGVQPTAITTRKIDDRFVVDRLTALGHTRTRIVAHLSRAIESQDSKGIAEWSAKAVEFTAKNPHRGITYSDLQRSVKARYQRDMGIEAAPYAAERQRLGLGG
jgi:hypothetical protein